MPGGLMPEVPAGSFVHKSCLHGPVGRVEPAAGGAAPCRGCSGRAAHLAANGRMQLALHPGVGPAAGSQIPGCCKKAKGTAWIPHLLGPRRAGSPSKTPARASSPTKALSNVEWGEREGRRLHKIGAEKRLMAGEGAAAGAGGARGTARRVANRTASLQHGASRWAGGKGNRKGMVG